VDDFDARRNGLGQDKVTAAMMQHVAVFTSLDRPSLSRQLKLNIFALVATFWRINLESHFEPIVIIVRRRFAPGAQTLFACLYAST